MPISYKPTIEGRGVSKMQKKGFFDCLSILFSKPTLILKANLIFCLFQLPIIVASTVIAALIFTKSRNIYISCLLVALPFAFSGPAMCGLTRITRDMSREIHVFAFKDFFDTFKKCFKKGLIVSIVQYAFYVAGFVAVVTYVMTPGLWPLAIVAVITVLYFALMQKYVYLMIISLNLGITKIFKNAFLLVLAAFKKSMTAMLFIIVSFAMSLFYAVYIISSGYSWLIIVFVGLALSLFHFSLQRLFINYFCFKAILEKVVEPYYEENSDEFEEDLSEPKTDKYKEDTNISERSEFVYVNGKLVKREILEQETIFKDDK